MNPPKGPALSHSRRVPRLHRKSPPGRRRHFLFFSKAEQTRPGSRSLSTLPSLPQSQSSQPASLRTTYQASQCVRYLQPAKLGPWSLPRALSCRVPCASRHFSLNRPTSNSSSPVPRLHLFAGLRFLPTTRLDSSCPALLARLHTHAFPSPREHGSQHPRYIHDTTQEPSATSAASRPRSACRPPVLSWTL